MDEVHLLVFHIGPVQEFIASARRSRDLWFGSWLLSELSRAAALEIVEQNEGDVQWSLIFPAPDSLLELRSERLNVANRIVARTRKDPARVGEAVRTKVLSRLRALRDDAFAQMGNWPFNKEAAQRQIDDVLELFWVSCPLSGDYEKARFRAEALMAARKVTREFGPSTWGGAVDKSSLDGRRESVIPLRAYKEMKVDALRRAYGVRRGEKLCGVGLMKRHGKRGDGDGFFSTSHVAAQSILGRLTEKDRPFVIKYKEKLKGLGMSPGELNTVFKPHPVFGCTDGHLLFPERLNEFFEGESLKAAQRALDKFLRDVFGKNRPSPYYALLHADGDHMGKAISAQRSIEQHRALSRSASAFAGSVENILEAHKGSLIYAGGDDVLAMLPLHTALECASYLKDAFCEKMSEFTFKDEDGQLNQPKLSAGMAIVHHLEPLSYALELVREAEAAAKAVEGKNALAVTLCKRAGSEQTVGDTWVLIDERLRHFITFYLQEEIPTELAYELRNIALSLWGIETKAVGRDLLSAEVKRVLGRKKVKDGSQPVKDSVKERLLSYVVEGGLSVSQLSNELITAREFALAYQLAGKALPHMTFEGGK